MNKNNRCGFLICILLVSSVLAACASTKSEPSDAFLAPITDQSMDTLGDVHFGLQLADSVQLNHYFGSETPKVDAYSALYDDLQLAVRAIVYYSADLLDLTREAKGDEALEPLIALLSTLDSNIRAIPSAQAHLGDLNADAVFVDMRNEEHIIGALRKSQPLINDYAVIVTEILAESDRALADAVLEVGEMIESSHSPMLAYRDKLTARQNSTLNELQIMDRVWSGDRSAWTELLASNWALSAEIGKNSAPSAANAKRAEQYLIDRLEVVATIRRQLDPAYTDYENELLELYEIEEHLEATLRLAYLIIEQWENAQARLAKGEKSAFQTFAKSLAELVAKSAAPRLRK